MHNALYFCTIGICFCGLKLRATLLKHMCSCFCVLCFWLFCCCHFSLNHISFCYPFGRSENVGDLHSFYPCCHYVVIRLPPSPFRYKIQLLVYYQFRRGMKYLEQPTPQIPVKDKQEVLRNTLMKYNITFVHSQNKLVVILTPEKT